jgi:uncharacterized membrane protein
MQIPRTAFNLGGVLLLALVVRAIDINGQSLFIDEINEIDLAKRPAIAIVNARDSMPPLYPPLLKAWLSVWQTDAAARWLSALCGTLSILCIWGIGRRLVGERTAEAAALIAAVLPLHVYFSQFVRCYALVFLIAALALWLLLRALDENRWRDWAGFAVVGSLGMYSHYYFAIFLATSLMIVWIKKWQLWPGEKPFAAYCTIVLLSLPLLWLLPVDIGFQKSIRSPRSLNIATFGYTYFSFFGGNALGASPAQMQTMTTHQATRAAAPWIVVVAAIVLVLGYEGWRALRDHEAALVVLVLLVVPVVLVGAISYVAGLNYNVRFVYWTLIAACLWLGAGVAGGWKKGRVRVALAGLLFVSLVAIYNRHFVARYQNEDLRGVAAYLHDHAATADTVFVASDYLAKAMRYYLGSGRQVVELPRAGEVNHVVSGPNDVLEAENTMAAHVSDDHGSWLVYSRQFHGDPTGLLIRQLSTRLGFQLEREFAGASVYRRQ